MASGVAENIPDHPRIVRPIGAEFELEDDAGRHADSEIDGEQGHPELGQALPLGVAGAHVDRFVKGAEKGKPQGQRDENPVIHGRHGELRPGPVHHT
jgi:hypothetical protein